MLPDYTEVRINVGQKLKGLDLYLQYKAWEFTDGDGVKQGEELIDTIEIPRKNVVLINVYQEQEVQND